MMHLFPERIPEFEMLYANYTLKPIEWVALDFATGDRSLEELAGFLPYKASDLEAAYRNLEALQLIVLQPSKVQGKAHNLAQEVLSAGTENKARDSSLSGATLPPIPHLLSTKLHPTYGNFVPKISDATYEMDLELQIYLEFVDAVKEEMTDEDYLGLDESSGKAGVKKAFFRRSKYFHPDKYFRKDIGPFEPLLADYYQRMTEAYNRLA